MKRNLVRQVSGVLGMSMVRWMDWYLADMYLTAVMVLHNLYGYPCITGADEDYIDGSG